jgi:hypothetical protein
LVSALIIPREIFTLAARIAIRPTSISFPRKRGLWQVVFFIFLATISSGYVKNVENFSILWKH